MEQSWDPLTATPFLVLVCWAPSTVCPRGILKNAESLWTWVFLLVLPLTVVYRKTCTLGNPWNWLFQGLMTWWPWWNFLVRGVPYSNVIWKELTGRFLSIQGIYTCWVIPGRGTVFWCRFAHGLGLSSPVLSACHKLNLSHLLPTGFVYSELFGWFWGRGHLVRCSAGLWCPGASVVSGRPHWGGWQSLSSRFSHDLLGGAVWH